MKAISIFILTLLFITGSFSSCSQTTQEEYNYLAKGYKIQLESGLDMKKGYKLKAYDTWGMDYGTFERQVTFKALYREGENKPCALLMIMERTNSDFKAYLCIPHYESTEKMWEQAYSDFKIATEKWVQSARGYSWAMVQFISYLTQ